VTYIYLADILRADIMKILRSFPTCWKNGYDNGDRVFGYTAVNV